MSLDQSVMVHSAADPSRIPSQSFAPRPNGVHGGKSRSEEDQRHYERRPAAVEPSLVIITSSPSRLHTAGRGLDDDDEDEAEEEQEQQKQQNNKNADFLVTSTPLESTSSRDRSNEGQEAFDPVSPTTSSLETPRHHPALEALPDHPGPPTTSYVPPSRQPAPQRAAAVKESKANSALTVTMPSTTARPSSMFFGSAHRRRNMANTNALTNYEADMNNKDRAKQKEAIQRFLDENIEEDWEFVRSPSRKLSDAGYDELGKTGRAAARWKERDEWLSNTNDSDDDPAMPTAASPDTASPTSDNFKFESPDDVGDVIKKRELAYKRRRERKLKDELEHNEGLRCFVARRDAWTGARKVKRQSTSISSNTLTNTLTPQHKDAIHIPNGSAEDLIDPIQSGYENDSSEDDTTEIPIAPPLLPTTNPIRASITPAAYKTIYDKVILQSLTPTCPINLKDILHSCVQGWQRDGEWPPKGTIPEPTIAGRKKTRKLSVASIFGIGRVAKELADEKEKEEGGSESGIRKSFHKIFGGKKDLSTGAATPLVNGNGNTNGNGHVIVG